METVKRHLIPYPERRHSETGKPYRHPYGTDKRLTFIFPQITESHF
jgi:hypothetical protein